MPVTFAESDQPLTIKSVSVETDAQVVEGEVEVCNTENERVKFRLKAHNETINALYYRNLKIKANTCKTFDLAFSRNFAEMSNVGDVITVTALKVKGFSSRDRYDISDPVTEVVTEGRADKGCGDQEGNDGTFLVCQDDFIYHIPSGLRIKVTTKTREYAVLKLTHVEWGGVQQMRLYKGRTRKIRSNFDELKRVEITNAIGENRSSLLIQIDSI